MAAVLGPFVTFAPRARWTGYVEIGMLTPPVGFNVYVVKNAVADSIALETIFRGCIWFMGCEVIIMLLRIGFPQLSLWLPGTMG